MKNKIILFLCFITFFSVFVISCKNNDSEPERISQKTSEEIPETETKKDTETKKTVLPAPQNFDVRYFNSQAGKNITFSFYAVEKAQHYLIYYNSTNDTSTAKPFISEAFPPIKYVFSGVLPNYFWVRAFDGEEYGLWSNVASPRSSLY